MKRGEHAAGPTQVDRRYWIGLTLSDKLAVDHHRRPDDGGTTDLDRRSGLGPGASRDGDKNQSQNDRRKFPEHGSSFGAVSEHAGPHPRLICETASCVAGRPPRWPPPAPRPSRSGCRSSLAGPPDLAHPAGRTAPPGPDGPTGPTGPCGPTGPGLPIVKLRLSKSFAPHAGHEQPIRSGRHRDETCLNRVVRRAEDLQRLQDATRKAHEDRRRGTRRASRAELLTFDQDCSRAEIRDRARDRQRRRSRRRGDRRDERRHDRQYKLPGHVASSQKAPKGAHETRACLA